MLDVLRLGRHDFKNMFIIRLYAEFANNDKKKGSRKSRAP